MTCNVTLQIQRVIGAEIIVCNERSEGSFCYRSVFLGLR